MSHLVIHRIPNLSDLLARSHLPAMGCALGRGEVAQLDDHRDGKAGDAITDPRSVPTSVVHLRQISPNMLDSLKAGHNSDAPIQFESPVPWCGCRTIGGRRGDASIPKPNQDRGLIRAPYLGNEQYALFGIFDGHGFSGEHVSEFVTQSLPKLLHSFMSNGSDTGECLRRTYINLEEHLQPYDHALESGTTATTILVSGKRLHIANAGDSRAIMCRRDTASSRLIAIDLTHDHKPSRLDECQRIMAAGGQVVGPGKQARVMFDNFSLGMSRSIGDLVASRAGVTCEPDIFTYDIRGDDYCVVMASDGVWEFLSSQQVANIIGSAEGADSQQICDTLCDRAREAWEKKVPNYCDDITAIVMMLPGERLMPSGCIVA